jgi:hypothetical protein
MQEVTDALLVTRALADDPQAFTLLIERYQMMALFIAQRYAGDREVAQELVQEALLQAYLSLHHLRDPARFKSWFYGIVLFEADPQHIAEERELRGVLREAVAVLSPNNRAVALLFYYPRGAQ